jgi:crotonobetainyl-CoA:carnitine CoA-transferase CaiB-like acyl-CoA transferase
VAAKKREVFRCAEMADIPADRQMVDSGGLVPIDDPRAGAALTVASLLAIEGVERIPPRFPPALGEPSVEILREVGYTDAQIDALLGAAVVVVQPK